ncbi:phage protein [Lactococcus piscium]|uniref:Phage protein n=1 Tax=Pseudolactococcus piscium TaxID=1364 RepID=A0A2A5S555_9LACT|nr:hypothetical protein [Lactococcus piscium]PCS08583.1 phage protein [Lactococcus piscium]
MKAFEEIETKLLAMKDDNSAGIDKYEDNILEAERALKIADENLMTAEETANLDVFNKAKDDIWASKHAIELYQKQLDKLKNTPLLPKVEYNQLISEIEKAADMAQDELNIKGAKLLAELKALSEESNAVFIKADELLNIAQYDIYKDADCLKASNGFVVTQTKEYRNNNTVRTVYLGKYLGNTFLDEMTVE